MTAMKYQFGNMKVKRFLALYRERYDDIKKQNLVSCQYESSNKPLARETKKSQIPMYTGAYRIMEHISTNKILSHREKKKPLDSPEQALNTATLHNHSPPGNQTDQPQHREDQNRKEDQFGIVQEGKGIVAQERNIGVVGECGQIEGISKEGGEKVTTAGEKRQKKELDDIKVEIQREERAVGNLARLSFVSSGKSLAFEMKTGLVLTSKQYPNSS